MIEGALAVFVALDMEERCLLPYLTDVRKEQVGGFPLIAGQAGTNPVLLCRTGIGKRAAEAAQALFSAYRPTGALSLGFAGATQSHLSSGQLILCRRTVFCQDNQTPPIEADERLLSFARTAAERLTFPHQAGICGTVVEVFSDPQAKADIGDRYGVQAVDMESHWLAMAAASAAVPFLAVKAIIDRLQDRLPLVGGVVSQDGQLRPLAAVGRLLRRPAALPQFLTAAMAARRASRSLSGFSGAFLSLWGREN